jgi:hypothetical protein
VPPYLVKRTFPGGLAIPADEAGAEAFGRVVRSNSELGVTWLHSYVGEDKEGGPRWEGPGPEAIRTATLRRALATP